jgi:hypothetical protein
LRACPFLGHCHFGNKCFAKIRTCNIMCVFITCMHAQIHDTINAHKKMKKSRRQIWQNVIILLSFCYHLDDWWSACISAWHHLSCDKYQTQNSLVEIWQMLSFCYHCYW